MAEVIPYTLYVAPYDDDWKVYEARTPATLTVFATRAEAEDHAKDLARAQGNGRIVVVDEVGDVVDDYTHDSGDDVI